jgi:hypothetical protein
VLSHTLTATGLTTTDLRDEFECRRAGEDDHATNECLHETHRNLEDHYHTTNADLARHATHSPSFPRIEGRCVVLAQHLRMVAWPPKFWPHLPEKYDGTINPIEFLQIYTSSILAAGGNEVIMVNYFPVALTGIAGSWLMNLPPGSLYSWEELCHQFMTNFESFYSRPDNEVDLHVV